MATKQNPAAFYRDAYAEAAKIPRAGLIYIGCWSVVSAFIDLLYWTNRPHFLPGNLPPIDYAISAVLIIGWLVVAYSVAMLMTGTRWSTVSLGRFFATSVAMALPALLAIGLILLTPPPGTVWMFAVVVVLSLGALVVFALLPGWPVLQATSMKLVGPAAAFRSTKGMRMSLFATSFIVGGLNRVVPTMSSAHDFPTACILAVANGAVLFVSMVIGLSIAVAAWRRMLPEIETSNIS